MKKMRIEHSFDQLSREARFVHLFRFWPSLSQAEKQQLIAQIEAIDLPVLDLQQQVLNKKSSLNSSKTFEPFTHFAYAGSQEDQTEGKDRIAAGQVGCLLLAGGQGSRLRYNGPKGIYPISVIKNKSLFQLCAEKVVAASKQAGRLLPLAIMTSSQNERETRAFFANAHFFGLHPDQIFFFSQKNLPFLDEKGLPFLETPSSIAVGPNGNGFCLKEFIQSGIAEQWSKQGIEYINLILIDNPLADPFDANLIGFHVRKSSEVTLKSTPKRDANEKVGVIVKSNGYCKVIEYTELSDEEKQAKTADGGLKHRCANLSLFCFSMSFIQSIDHKNLPLHLAWKPAQHVDESGVIQVPDQPNAWKFEAFIFDILNQAKHVAVLLYPREDCFAPLKNLTGQDSPETVRAAIEVRERKIIQEITGQKPPLGHLELAADFYYPTPALLADWKGRSIQEGYQSP